MSLTEIILILVVALVVFGQDDLPVIARTLGKIFFQARKYINEISKEFQETVEIPAQVINDSLKTTPDIVDNPESIAEQKDTELLVYETNEIKPNIGQVNKEHK